MSFSSAELIPEKSVLTLKVKMFMTTVLLLRLCWQLIFSFVICQELEEGVVFNVYGRRRRDRTGQCLPIGACSLGYPFMSCTSKMLAASRFSSILDKKVPPIFNLVSFFFIF